MRRAAGVMLLRASRARQRQLLAEHVPGVSLGKELHVGIAESFRGQVGHSGLQPILAGAGSHDPGSRVVRRRETYAGQVRR